MKTNKEQIRDVIKHQKVIGVILSAIIAGTGFMTVYLVYLTVMRFI